MKSTINRTTYKAIYRFLDRVSPIDSDCGTLCGAACCTCTYEPEDVDYHGENDENAESYMGLYLLPGEDQIFKWDPKAPDTDSDWIDWGHMMAEEYEFPESWQGKVDFIQCRTAPVCRREKRPIQCRTSPLAPHINEDGEVHIILNCDGLPYDCPLISQNTVYGGHISLSESFIQATYTVWKHLIRDDLVKMDSDFRIEDDAAIDIMK